MKRLDSEGKIVKKIYSTIILLFVFIGFIVPCVQAKYPKPLFDRSVQLDDSGRPLYNSWERQEYLRKQRARQKQITKQKQSDAQKQPAQTTKPQNDNQASQAQNSQPASEDNAQAKQADVTGSSGKATTEPTPSSAVINR